MKTTLLLVFTRLVFASTANLLVASANDIVLDIDGHPLQTGTSYYILPVIRGNGGGLTLYPRTIKGCPIDVVQEPNEVNRGLPVTFTPVNPKNKSIEVSTDLKIQFSVKPTCAGSAVWELDTKKNVTSGQVFVTTGVEGNPFRIEKFEDDYKLVYCAHGPPVVCRLCPPRCVDLGIVIQKSGTRRLALNTGKAWNVFFKKA